MPGLRHRVAGAGFRQGVDTGQQQRDVVLAAARQGQRRERLRGAVQIVAAGGQGLVDIGGFQVFIGAIGGQQVDLAGLHAPRAVVDLDRRARAQRPAQIGLGGRYADPVIDGKLLQRMPMQPIDARVAHVQQVGLPRLEDQRAEGADVAAIAVEAGLAVPALGVEPGVDGGQHALRRPPHGPGFGRAVVVLEEGADGGSAGDLAHRAAADAVRQRQRDALGHAVVADGVGHAMKVLVDRLPASVGMLANADLEPAGHGVVASMPDNDQPSARLLAVL
ncbi:hypothetical protein D3C81_903070 [compost metagenome]